jgi:hypothetical protein
MSSFWLTLIVIIVLMTSLQKRQDKTYPNYTLYKWP